MAMSLAQHYPDYPSLLESIPSADAKRRSLFLSVIVPVLNERHTVGPSLCRLLALTAEQIRRMQVIVVDDGSTDDTRQVIERIAGADRRVELLRHPRSYGRGAAIRTGIERAAGEVTIVHNPDMEYDPEDIAALLRPFLEEGADAVFGSRYMAAAYRRALNHRRGRGDRLVTAAANWVTDLDLSDAATCYKAVNTKLLRSLPLRYDDDRIEIELAVKLAKRRARVFEAPVRYLPRGLEEGGRRGGALRSLVALARLALIDDIYRADAYGSNILADLQAARRFNRWMGDTLRPFVGDRVLEIGAGIGTLTSQFIPRELYVASDINPHYLDYLKSYALGKPYLRVLKVDATAPEDFAPLEGQFDTALMINVLEHVPDEQSALRSLYAALRPGGRAVILVPQHPFLYGSLDAALEHRERYTRAKLEESLTTAGFQVERLFDFNRASVPSWLLNGRVLKKTGFSRIQLKALEILMPAIRRMDRALPWAGLSVIGIGRKP